MRQPRRTTKGNTAARDLRRAYESVFGSEEGRIVLLDLALFSGWNAAPHEGAAAIDPLVLARQDGKNRLLQRMCAMSGLQPFDLLMASVATLTAQRKEE